MSVIRVPFHKRPTHWTMLFVAVPAIIATLSATTATANAGYIYASPRTYQTTTSLFVESVQLWRRIGGRA